MARTVSDGLRLIRPGLAAMLLTCRFRLERVTGIEPAVSASDCESPLVAGVNGLLIAQRPGHVVRVGAPAGSSEG
jgi:hypothetical protein